MNGELTLPLAFTTGVFGALHCLGMCGGIASGFFVRYGRGVASVAQYHAARIFIYAMFGVAGAVLGRVLVQTGVIGKGQGLLMMTAGLVIVALGLDMLGLLPRFGRKSASRRDVRLGEGELISPPAPRTCGRWLPVLTGAMNGVVPCGLVFSIAIKAAATADPLQAGLLMLAFGLGTVPTMALVSLTGMAIGQRVRGIFARLAGATVVALGLWTLYEGWVFFDIMRGLSNW